MASAPAQMISKWCPLSLSPLFLSLLSFSLSPLSLSPPSLSLCLSPFLALFPLFHCSSPLLLILISSLQKHQVPAIVESVRSRLRYYRSTLAVTDIPVVSHEKVEEIFCSGSSSAESGAEVSLSPALLLLALKSLHHLGWLVRVSWWTFHGEVPKV
jgi:hypothetical protein